MPPWNTLEPHEYSAALRGFVAACSASGADWELLINTPTPYRSAEKSAADFHHSSDMTGWLHDAKAQPSETGGHGVEDGMEESNNVQKHPENRKNNNTTAAAAFGFSSASLAAHIHFLQPPKQHKANSNQPAASSSASASGLAPTHTPDKKAYTQWQFYIRYHETYQAPVLLFSVATLDGREITDLESLLCPPLPVLGRCEFLGAPYWFVHPCRTAAVLGRSFFADVQTRKAYDPNDFHWLIFWLSLYAQPFAPDILPLLLPICAAAATSTAARSAA